MKDVGNLALHERAHGPNPDRRAGAPVQARGFLAGAALTATVG